VVRIAFYLLIIVLVGCALFLCASKVEIAALIWRFHSGDFRASMKLSASGGLGKAAQKEVERYCHLLLIPALDEGAPGTLSKLYSLGQTGSAALNNYFVNALSETAIEIPVSSSQRLTQTLPQDVKHLLFLNKDGELEVAGEAFQANAPSAGNAVLFVDSQTSFEYLLLVLETLGKGNTRAIFFAANSDGKFSFARVELTTPGLLYTLFPNTLVVLSDENSFFNHTKTQDSAAFSRAIERARKESPSPNFFVRFIVGETVHFDPLFKLITFCLENETSPLFKLLTDEDAYIPDEEAELQGRKK
jgi:hypothetical protein